MSKLLLDEPPLLVIPSLAARVGLNEAIVLQQLHYFLQRHTSVEIDGARWHKANLESWRKSFPWWSEVTIRRTFDQLVKTGLVARRRGREANVYTIHYDELERLPAPINLISSTDQSDANTDQSDRSLVTEEVEDKEELGASADDGEHLPGMAPPPSPPKAQAITAASREETEVWDYYMRVFGDRVRIRELTAPRQRTLRKALAAVGNNVSVCKSAIDGLKAYRDKNPERSKDVGLSVIFETGPTDRSNLTEKIEWWASQAGDRTEVPNSVPSLHRARVVELALAVLQQERQPDSTGVRERADQARATLKGRFGLMPESDGNGKLTGWIEVEKG